MKWSEEKVNQLKSLAFAGMSNPEIAKKIGVKVTDVYAKRSQLGITIDKVKAAKAGTVNPEFEAAALPKLLSERFQKMRELDQKRAVLNLLELTLMKADETIQMLRLVDDGCAVEIFYKNGAVKRAYIECDSLLAIIVDVTNRCLYGGGTV